MNVWGVGETQASWRDLGSPGGCRRGIKLHNGSSIGSNAKRNAKRRANSSANNQGSPGTSRGALQSL